MSEIKPKKLTSRNIAIILGIICIILVASVASLLVVLSEKDSTIQTDENQIDSLNYQISGLNNTLKMVPSQVVFDQSANASTNSQSSLSVGVLRRT